MAAAPHHGSLASGGTGQAVRPPEVSVEENEKHWLIVGLALNKVVVPALRDFVKDTVNDLHGLLSGPPHTIHQQSYHNHLKHLPQQVATSVQKPQQLMYGNINSNESITEQNKKEKWDYSVKTPIEFAKLFLQPFMAKFSTFEHCDASACLGLIMNINDSLYKNVFRTVKSEAEKVREIRNKWAHCHYEEWDEVQFEESFKTMDDLVQILKAKAGVKESLEEWKKKGLTVFKEHELPSEKLKQMKEAVEVMAQHHEVHSKKVQLQMHALEDRIQAIESQKTIKQTDDVFLAEYREKLVQFHKDTTLEDANFSELSTKYVMQMMYVGEEDLQGLEEKEKQTGLSEYTFAYKDASKRRGEDAGVVKRKVKEEVEAENLFGCTKGCKDCKEKKHRARTVLLLGVPGIGKTELCHKLLQDIIDNKLFVCESEQDRPIPFIMKFRNINLLNKTKLSFKTLLLQNSPEHGTETDWQSEVWRCLKKNEERIIILMDGYDEAEGLGINFDKRYTGVITNVDADTEPQILIQSLISKRILPKARVFITSRHFCWSKLKGKVDLTVELEGLYEGKLKELVKAELGKKYPKLYQSFIEYLHEHPTLMSLCYVPRHARCLIDYVKYKNIGHDDRSVDPDVLPKTIASLLLTVLIKLMEQSGRDLEDPDEDPDDLEHTDKAILKKKKVPTATLR